MTTTGGIPFLPERPGGSVLAGTEIAGRSFSVALMLIKRVDA